ncbi:RNA polymerase sigma-70 factor (ECF subfamily) [Bradyrhizobium sp. USDA 4341]
MRDEFGLALAALIPRLRAYARALTRGTTIEADDLVHDTMVEALSSEHNFDGESLDRWVFTIQRRKFYRLARAAISIPQKQDPRALEEGSLCDAMIAQPSQFDAAYLAEVQAAINALPTNKREVLHLTAVSGMDQREVAEILGITETAVKMRVFQARRAVDEFLKAPRTAQRPADLAERGKGKRATGRRGNASFVPSAAVAPEVTVADALVC